MPNTDLQYFETLYNPNLGTGIISDVEQNTEDINQNKQDIETNAQNIATNAQNIATNAQNIATNTQDIATNAQNIATNTQNIATNTQNIATNTQDIATNAQNIATNTQNIATNTQDIATNAQNIATNTQNIATNAQDIATNAQNIQTNTNWRNDFNSQTTGELLTRDGTDSFNTEAFGNNFTSSEIKKSSLGGILNSHIFAIDRQGSYTFQDFNQSGGQYNNSVIESTSASGTLMNIALPSTSGQLAVISQLPSTYWDINASNNIFNTNSGGRVGIGTNSPNELLEVSGTAPRIRIYDGTTTRNPALEFVRGSSTFGADNFNDWRLHNEGGNLKFFSQGTSGYTGNTLWLSYLGRVGIKRDNPLSILQIGGTNHDSHFNYSTGESTYIRGGKNASSVFIADTGLKRVRIGDSAVGAESTLDIVGNGSNSHFNYYSNNSTYIRAGTTSADVYIADNTASGQVGILTSTPNASFNCEINGSTLISDNFKTTGEGLFNQNDQLLIQTDASNGVKLNLQSSGGGTDYMKIGAYNNVNNIQNFNRDLVIYGGSEVARFKSNYMELQNATHSKLNFVNTTTAGSYNYMAFYDGSTRIYYVGQDGGNNGDFMIGTETSGRSLLVDRNNGKFKIQKNTEILGSLSFDAGVNAQTYITIGGNSLASNLYGIQLVSTASERKHVSLGQDSTHSGFLSWEHNATPANGILSLSTYGGNNKIVIQNDGGQTLFGKSTNNSVATSGKLNLCNNDGNSVAFEFRTNDSASSGADYPAIKMVSGFTNTTWNSAYLKFQSHHSGTPTYNDTMTIQGNQVGILRSPDAITATLDVNGTFKVNSTATFSGLNIFENTITLQNPSPYVILRDTTDRDDIQIRFDGLYSGNNQTNARISTQNDYLNLETTTTQGFNGIRFKTNNLLAGTIDNNQYFYINNRLGLGGITPQVTLDVSGSIKFDNGNFNNYNSQINHNDTTFKIDYYDLANPSAHPEKFWKIQQEGADSTYHDLFSYNNTTKQFLTIGNLNDLPSNPSASWRARRNWMTYDNTGASFFGDLTTPYGFTIEDVTQADRIDDVSKQKQETLTFNIKGHKSNEPITTYPDRLVSGQVAEYISLDGTSSGKSFFNPEYTSQTLDANVVGRSSLIMSGKELNGRYNAEEIKNNVFTPKQITDLTPVTRNTENMGQMNFSGTNAFLDSSSILGRVVIQKDFIAPQDYNNSHNTTEPNTATEKQVYTWTAYMQPTNTAITPLLFKRKFAESRDGYSEDTWNCLLIGIGSPRSNTTGTAQWLTFEFGLQVGTDIIQEDCCMGFYCGDLQYNNLTQLFTISAPLRNPVWYNFLDNLPNASVWTPDAWNQTISGSTSGVAGETFFQTTEKRIRQNGEAGLNMYFFTDNFFNKAGFKADYIPIDTNAWASFQQRQYYFYFTARQKQAEYHQPSNKVISESLSKGRYENIGFNSPLLSAPNNSNYQLTQLKAPQFVNGQSKKYQAVSAVSFIGDDNFIISFWLNLSTNADTNTLQGQQTQIVLGSGGRNLNTGFQINIVAISGSSYSMHYLLLMEVV